MKRIAHIIDGHIHNVSLAQDDAPIAPGAMLESEALAQGIPHRSVASSKQWSTPTDFLSEFTDSEKAAIDLSSDGVIAALRLELSTWGTYVSAADPRVIAGISRLVELGILTTERQQQILGTPQ